MLFVTTIFRKSSRPALITHYHSAPARRSLIGPDGSTRPPAVGRSQAFGRCAVARHSLQPSERMSPTPVYPASGRWLSASPRSYVIQTAGFMWPAIQIAKRLVPEPLLHLSILPGTVMEPRSVICFTPVI